MTDFHNSQSNSQGSNQARNLSSNFADTFADTSATNPANEASGFFAGKTVVVAGAGGFVGSHLVERLLESGAKVIGLDNFITGRERNVSEVKRHPLASAQYQFIQADVIKDPRTYLPESLLNGNEALAAVFHLASPASPPLYQAHPVETYQVNSFATHNLLTFIKHTHPKARFIFASTSEVYGDPEVHPQNEQYWGRVNPNGIRSCYDEAKRLGETICGVFERDFELDVRIMRIFNTYGPRMDPNDGRVIPNFVKQALNTEQLTIYGDGSQTRSYCYVSDLVEGIFRLGGLPNLKGQTINLGNPDEYTILETAKVIGESVSGQPVSDADFDFQPLPGDDPTRRRPDISRARELLAWQPTVSLADGLRETIAYFRDIEGIGKES